MVWMKGKKVSKIFSFAIFQLQKINMQQNLKMTPLKKVWKVDRLHDAASSVPDGNIHYILHACALYSLVSLRLLTTRNRTGWGFAKVV